jgi:hypothetical protein
MRKHIEAALMQSRGRVEGPDGAARLLEINPYSLRARMRKLGIHWAAFRTDLSALPPLMPAGISLLPKKDLGGF